MPDCTLLLIVCSPPVPVSFALCHNLCTKYFGVHVLFLLTTLQSCVSRVRVPFPGKRDDSTEAHRGPIVTVDHESVRIVSRGLDRTAPKFHLCVAGRRCCPATGRDPPSIRIAQGPPRSGAISRRCDQPDSRAKGSGCRLNGAGRRGNASAVTESGLCLALILRH